MRITDEMVETGARAVCVHDGYDPDAVDNSNGDRPQPLWMNWQDEVRTALTAALAQAPTGVKVKPLEWKPTRANNGDIYCNTIVGQYAIGDIHGEIQVFLRRVEDGQDYDETVASCDNFPEAKAAAQADCEARIRSALSPEPEAPRGGQEPEDEADRISRAWEWIADWQGRYDIVLKADALRELRSALSALPVLLVMRGQELVSLERVAKNIAFAGRSEHDISENADDFWAHTNEDGRKRARAMALAALSSPPQGQREGWRPIETAPKDETYVLLANEHGTWVGKYVDRFTSGFKPENPWQTMMLNHRHMPRYCSTVPTHWMPLPASPHQGGRQ